jgi:uracil-DNA glycosylase family 4
MNPKMTKEKELSKLAKLRQKTKYDGYKSIADYEDGFYECDYVSPYSKSANNINADVFIVLQDWSSDDNMHGVCHETNRLGYTPSVGTNIKLIEYLKKYLDLELKDTYTTNLFPFIKMGDMSANIPIKDMRRAAKDFTLPMIQIIRPKIVIALGRKTYNSLWDCCDDKVEVVESSFKYGTTKVFHQPHPAARISNLEKEQRWFGMKNYLDIHENV